MQEPSRIRRAVAIGVIATAVILGIGLVLGWKHRLRALHWAADWIEARLLPVKQPDVPDPATYQVLKSELERWRVELAGRHRKARNPQVRAAIEAEARVLIEKVMPEMMRCWLGTPWDFNGIAAAPGGGKIACGYFVSTVLQDAGFRVDRYRLAQQPSSLILHTFLPHEQCRLTAGQDYNAFADGLQQLEAGIYLCGLDHHVGFLVVGDETFRFVHASASSPPRVVDQSRDDATALRVSNWRMIGNLSASPDVIRAWLKGDEIEVREN
ncbi:MAG TPA: hypothetical protein VFY13_03985 [Luteolibacter sp.]|nr:hypothetical protein [Luteolibacter sp.]